MYLPAPVSYSYNFLLNLKKGCKYFRQLMPHSLYNQLDWKCFEHHQTKIQDLTTAEEEKIAKTSVKGNCLIRAKELQYLTIRNQFDTNSTFALLKRVVVFICSIIQSYVQRYKIISAFREGI